MRSRVPVLVVISALTAVRALSGAVRPAAEALPAPPPPFAADPRPRRSRSRPLVAFTGLVAAPAFVLTGLVPVLPGDGATAVAAGDTVAVAADRPVGAEELRAARERVLAERGAAAEAAAMRAARSSAARESAAQEVAARAEALRPKHAAPVDRPVGSGFGPRWGRLHAGLDFPAPLGTPIRAAADGIVEEAGPAGGYGNLVTVRHADGIVTAYGHMKVIDVVPGQPVLAGQVIAQVGNEGRSTGPHLHFEVRTSTGHLDPYTWLTERGVPLTRRS